MIQLTREVRFSARSTTDVPGGDPTAERVLNTWAGWPSAVEIAPFLAFRVTVTGKPDAETGYLCNIVILDQQLRDIAIPESIRYLGETDRPRPAPLLDRCWHHMIGSLPQQAELVRLELVTTPYQYFAIDREHPNVIEISQQFEFSAAHRLHCPKFSDEENRRLFGKCNNPNGHGHNYVVEVAVAGRMDPVTGQMISIAALEETVKTRIVDRFDHKHLNEDCPDFRELNPTVENIAQVVWQLLDGAFGEAKLQRVRVYETPKTWAEFRGEPC